MNETHLIPQTFVRRLGSLIAVFVVAIGLFSSTPVAYAAVACAVGSAAQNNIVVEPSHGQVFYIDTGVTPKLDAGILDIASPTRLVLLRLTCGHR